MDDKAKRLIKDGRDFSQFPNMKTAKIFRPDPSQKPEVQSTAEHAVSDQSTGHYIQIEVAQAEVEVALQDHLKFSKAVDEVDDVDWSVHIETHHLNVGAATVNLNGILKGDIMYFNKKGTYSRKYTIPWQTTCHIAYSNMPEELQQTNKTKHLFKDDAGESSVHREVVWHYQQPVACHLNTAKITSTEQLLKRDNHTRLELQVVLRMSVSFTQLQRVNI